MLRTHTGARACGAILKGSQSCFEWYTAIKHYSLIPFSSATRVFL